MRPQQTQSGTGVLWYWWMPWYLWCLCNAISFRIFADDIQRKVMAYDSKAGNAVDLCGKETECLISVDGCEGSAVFAQPTVITCEGDTVSVYVCDTSRAGSMKLVQPSHHLWGICSRNALGALVASVSQALPPWVGARGNGFYGIDPLSTSLRKYGQQVLLRRPTVFNGNIGNKDQSKEENEKKPCNAMNNTTRLQIT